MLNKDIMSCFEGLQNLRKATDRRLPARTSFAIIRNIKTLQPIVEDIQSTYRDLVDKYAEPIDNEHFRVKEENIKKMIKIIPDLEFAITSLEDPKEENFEQIVKDFLDAYVRQYG